ncbi:hypothetical protein PGT21_017897 [Puccinia graminis f. sp. tritici]|uniref:Uncharacterized protein n=1 Tax=Puccinia graminis f. sp. tritici TaxID=56615 RepID=A0A5B0MVN2_PUCGR|nr:hypothetical protein PGT21_017897 [Puccinia graminis f. sp. tritici]
MKKGVWYTFMELPPVGHNAPPIAKDAPNPPDVPQPAAVAGGQQRQHRDPAE